MAKTIAIQGGYGAFHEIAAHHFFKDEEIRILPRKGLSEEFIIKLFRSIHQESINHQTSVMNKE